MGQKQKPIKSEEFIELVKQLSKADQKKLLWRMKWMVFRHKFSKESIVKHVGRVVEHIQLKLNRVWLSRFRPSIQTEINDLWKSAKRDYRLKFLPDADFSKVVLAVKKGFNLDLYPKAYLQPWLYIFDQGIMWLTALYFAIGEGNKSPRRHIKPIEFLIGAACSQANSIRMLCVEGHDVPAKAVLRSFMETLMIGLVLMSDEYLRKQYMKAQAPYEAWDFWRKHLRERELLRRIREIFVENDLGEEHIKEFTDWVEDEFSLTSQAVHSSYLAIALASNPFPLNKNKLLPGIFGVPTAFSYRTLSFASRFLWVFSMLALKFLLIPQKGKRSPLLKLHKGSDTSKLMAVSHSIYWQLIENHWSDELTTG